MSNITKTFKNIIASNRFLLFACILWAVIAFLNLYFFSYPSMDSWCYFSPVAASTAPGDLTTPLLGPWEGLDHTWGLHWPGGPFIGTLFFWAFPTHPATNILYAMLLWGATAIFLRVVALRLLDSRLLANAAAILFLFDRAAFNMAWFQRHEMLSLSAELILLILWTYPSPRSSWKIVARYALWTACFTVMTVTHPSSLGIAGIIVICLWMRALVGKTPKRFADATFAALGGVLGVGLLIGYFWAHPMAYAAFKDHAQINFEITNDPNGTNFFGKTLLLFPEFYFPFFTGAFLVFGLFVGSASVLIHIWGAKGIAWADRLEDSKVWLMIVVLGVGQALLNLATYNAYYMILFIPFSILLILRLLSNWPKPPTYLVAIGFLVLFLHLSIIPLRLVPWARSGFPNYRAVLAAAWAQIPSDRLVLIPDVLWENAIQSHSNALMNNLPNNATAPRRAAYENFLYNSVQRGDILIVDWLQSKKPEIHSDPRLRWIEIPDKGLTALWQGVKKRGFDLKMYELVEKNE